MTALRFAYSYGGDGESNIKAGCICAALCRAALRCTWKSPSQWAARCSRAGGGWWERRARVTHPPSAPAPYLLCPVLGVPPAIPSAAHLCCAVLCRALLLQVDLREFAAFVRDPRARVNCVLLPFSARLDLDMHVPQVGGPS